VQYFFCLLQIQTVAVGAAIGQACLLLAAGEKGRRYMMPHATGLHLLPKGFLQGLLFLSTIVSVVDCKSLVVYKSS
jgi:hypothetical protein